MKVGAIFPHDTIEPDAGAIREYVRGVEALGYSHVLCYDHVIGANRASRPDWQGYDLDSPFYEPLSLLSFIAGMTETMGIATGVVVLPQRQTVLIAKQAATLDLLSNGRLRLGVGTGWNPVEYEALGMPFASRGKMLDDQIDLMRRLWTERAVTVATPLHTITDAGLWPLPVQRPIPIWLGGGGVHPYKGWAHVDRVIKRIADKGDGWMPTFDPDETGAEIVEKFRGYCRSAGRDPAAVPIEALLLPMMHPDLAGTARAWAELGATQFCTNVSGPEVKGVEGNLKRLEEVRSALRAGEMWTDAREVQG